MVDKPISIGFSSLYGRMYADAVFMRYGKRTVRIEYYEENGVKIITMVLWKHKRDNTPWALDLHVCVDTAVVESIKLWYANGGYGGMTLEQFVNKAVPRDISGQNSNQGQ